MALIRGGITVKRHVALCCDALEANTGASSFGTYVGHSPPEGPTQAVDIFNPDNASGHALQDRVCAYLKLHAKHFGVRYCIRREYIWNIERAGEGWRRQSHKGNRTADHYDHVHATFYASAPASSDTPTPTPTIDGDEMFRYWSKRGGQRLSNGVYASRNGLEPAICDTLDKARMAPILDRIPDEWITALDRLPPFPGE